MATLEKINYITKNKRTEFNSPFLYLGLTQLAHKASGIRVKGQGEPLRWAALPT